MAKTLKTYSQWRVEKLSDPERAARYLNAAKKESREAFLHAVKNVIQANQVAKVAKEAGVSRESVYRSFSAEGNPTFDTLSSILEAVDIDFKFVPSESAASASGSTSEKATAPTNTNLHTGKVSLVGYFNNKNGVVANQLNWSGSSMVGTINVNHSDIVFNCQDSICNNAAGTTVVAIPPVARILTNGTGETACGDLSFGGGPDLHATFGPYMLAALRGTNRDELIA